MLNRSPSKNDATSSFQNKLNDKTIWNKRFHVWLSHMALAMKHVLKRCKLSYL